MFHASKCPTFVSLSLVPDSPSDTHSRKAKGSRMDRGETTNARPSTKHRSSDYAEVDRNNIYAQTPPQLKSTSVNRVHSHLSHEQRRQRPPIPLRTDSSRSLVSSATTRPNGTPTMTRSADVLSTADMETSILNHNTRCLNLITNGNHFVPLQSVKEDECLEENAAADEKTSFFQVNQSSKWRMHRVPLELARAPIARSSCSMAYSISCIDLLLTDA